MSVVCGGNWPGDGKRGCASGTSDFGILLLGSGGDCLWFAENEDYMYALFHVWHDGRNGGMHPGAGICHNAHDRIAFGSLCLSGDLDLYDLSVGQNPADALHIIPNLLGTDGSRPSCVLCCRVQEAQKEYGVKYNKDIIFLFWTKRAWLSKQVLFLCAGLCIKRYSDWKVATEVAHRPRGRTQNIY